MESLLKFFRFLFLIVGVLLNLLLFFLISRLLGRYATTLVIVLSVIEVILLLNAEGTTVTKLFWAVVIALAPFFGGPLYALFRYQNRKYRKARNLSLQHQKAAPYIKGTYVPADKKAGLIEYLCHTRGFSAYSNTDITFYPWGDLFFADLMEEIRKAEHYIYIEMFIISKGSVENELFSLLFAKAAEGVDVRILYDGTNMLNRHFPEALKKAAASGISCRIFEPVRPAITVRQNGRDHRKIISIDGVCAFTGGFNLADEYANIISRFGKWKDTGIRLKGEAALSLTSFFIGMWNADAVKEPGSLISFEVLSSCPPLRAAVQESSDPSTVSPASITVPYCDGPLYDGTVAEDVYLGILSHAEKYVHIMTPYLILTDQMLHALKFTAERGVDVSIILPGIPDKSMVWWLAHSYYPELIRSGVRIYEYTPGFVHAKEFISDDREAVVGTVNLDFRSLYLHFEDAVYMQDCRLASGMEADFNDTLKDCRLIGQKEYRAFPFIKLAAGNIARIFAPLL